MVLFFSKVVGIGSDRQCLFGSWRTAMMMSSSVSSSKRCSEQPGGAPVNVGHGALLVDARTPSTFSSKKRWKSEALTPAGEGMDPRPIRLSIDCHSWYGLDSRCRPSQSKTIRALVAADHGRRDVSPSTLQWQRQHDLDRPFRRDAQINPFGKRSRPAFLGWRSRCNCKAKAKGKGI